MAEIIVNSKSALSINGITYFFYGKLDYHQNSINLEFQNKLGEKEIIYDIKKYIGEGRPINEFGEKTQGDIENFIKKNLINLISDLLNNSNTTLLNYPKNILNIINTQKNKWVENAIIAAFQCHENVHYIIQEDKVKPVEFNSSGVVQESTSWSDGLHQFLQLKHNLKFTSESFTTNYSSNIVYLKSYQNNIIGLTGTFGSLASQEMMREIYNNKLYFVPSAREKRVLPFSDLMPESRQEWIQSTCEDAYLQATVGRGVLIICKTIEDADDIFSYLKKNRQNNTLLRKYTLDNDKNQSKLVNSIEENMILVATNLAGRGMDIKPTEAVENAGGMHVILTFFAENKRIEDQAYGRTGRQGKSGTIRRILNVNDLLLNGYVVNENISNINLQRNEREQIHVKSQNKQIQLINAKDEIFSRFCRQMKRVRKKAKNIVKSDNHCRSRLNIKGLLSDSWYGYTPEKCMKKYYALSLENRWALFLLSLSRDENSLDKIHKIYNRFKKEIDSDIEKNKLIKNANYSVKIANSFMYFMNYSKGAKQFYDYALKLDKNNIQADFGKAWHITYDKKNDYKDRVLKQLKKTVDLINN